MKDDGDRSFLTGRECALRRILLIDTPGESRMCSARRGAKKTPGETDPKRDNHEALAPTELRKTEGAPLAGLCPTGVENPSIIR